MHISSINGKWGLSLLSPIRENIYGDQSYVFAGWFPSLATYTFLKQPLLLVVIAEAPLQKIHVTMLHGYCPGNQSLHLGISIF